MARFLNILSGLSILGLAACSVSTKSPGLSAPVSASPAAANSTASPELAAARQKIKHVVIIMQENRSFDSYFGTYPGADGFPMQDGKFTVCVNDPAKSTCVYPFHDPADLNFGGPHSAANAA